jgi:GNAT superfamily N-acetyltransferase
MNTSPEQVVQAQLDAYNAHDVDALCRIYADDACQYQHPATLLARGTAAIRTRFADRFAASKPHARLLRRTVLGDTVIDHEYVFSGPTRVELMALYEVKEGRIVNASFVFGQTVRVRPATFDDIPAMEALIARSGIALSKGFYTDEQAAAVTRHVFGVDTQLVKDGTYFVVERDGTLLACGGWSKRATLFGADRVKGEADPLLDPATQPGRIRAFFVDPSSPRQGLGTMLIGHCEAEAARAGFTTLEMAATMPGVPLYRSVGYQTVEEFQLDLPGGVRVPLARMRKAIA